MTVYDYTPGGCPIMDPLSESLPSGSKWAAKKRRRVQRQKQRDDAKLVRTARDFRRGILGDGSPHRMCAVICYPLCTLLLQSGVRCRIETLYFRSHPTLKNHVVLRLWDNRILDPTADQFDGMPDVYLGDFPELFQHWA